MGTDRPGVRAASVCLTGLGNIGRPLARFVARIAGIGRITLVDFDSYERENLTGQAIGPEDVGRPKAEAAAAELRRIRPDLQVVPLAFRVENIPLALLRADVWLAALDSKRARMMVSEFATRLGVPVVDAGVEPEHGLIRLTVYRPGPTAPCYECSMRDGDYANVEQVLPCRGRDGAAPAAAPPTRAPAYLGGYAASLAAAECEKLISDREDRSLLGRELIASVSDHSRFISKLSRKQDCRFDHQTWSGIERRDEGPDQLTPGHLLGLVPAMARGSSLQLRVPGQRFVTRVRCSGCGRRRPLLHLSGRLSETECRDCQGAMAASGFDTLDSLVLDALPSRALRRPLRSFGFLPGDVLEVTAGQAARYCEIGGTQDA